VKRSAALMPLSHEHHQALFVALQLRRAQDADAAAAAMLEFYDADGRAHFEIEEGILLPAWLELDPAADRAAAERVLSEHLSIRCEVRRLRAGTVGLDGLHRLGEALERHVRFEERELFPAIEAALDETALARVGREVAAAEGR
jgi:hemerythrin-like domain-containing protein